MKARPALEDAVCLWAIGTVILVAIVGLTLTIADAVGNGRVCSAHGLRTSAALDKCVDARGATYTVEKTWTRPW